MAMADRQIKSSIWFGRGSVFGPGQEEQLNKILADEQIASLKKKGLITGEDWGRVVVSLEAPPEEEDEEDAMTQLPSNFPGRLELQRQGYTTVEAVSDLTKKQLLAIPGIGSATVAKIFAALE